jgi:hypothetical protein
MYRLAAGHLVLRSILADTPPKQEGTKLQIGIP